MTPTYNELKCILYAMRYFRAPKQPLYMGIFNKKFTKPQPTEFNVSTIKSFSTLWEKFGLYHKPSIFFQSQKIECAKYWIAQLYSSSIDVDAILKDIAESEKKRISELAKHSHDDDDCCCIPFHSAIDDFPKEIDKRFGYYETANNLEVSASN